MTGQHYHRRPHLPRLVLCTLHDEHRHTAQLNLKAKARLAVEMCEQGHSVDLAMGLGSPQVGRVVREAEQVFGFLVDFVDYRAIDAVTEKSAEAVELPGSNSICFTSLGSCSNKAMTS